MRPLFVAGTTAALLGLAALPAHADAGWMSPQRHAASTANWPGDTVHLADTVDLLTVPRLTWVDIPLEVRLPLPGSYALDANIHGRIWGKPPVNTLIRARLFNVTKNSAVPESRRMVNHLASQTTSEDEIGRRTTAPISEDIVVSEPTTIRVQILWNNLEGAATIAEISTDKGGTSSLRFVRV
jgi:hypothetical protein